MPHIHEIILRIQIMELLQSTLTDTLKEIGHEMSSITRNNLIKAQHSLSNEIMMNSLRIKYYDQPKTNDENKS